MLNGPELEAVPAAAVRTRRNADARRLSGARWLVRRKRDGRHLACVDDHGGLWPMHPDARRVDAGLADLLVRLDGDDGASCLPTDHVVQALQALGVPADYGDSHRLALVAEPARLAHAGVDRFGRPLWLDAGTAPAWRRMRVAAASDGVVLEAVSGYRSHAYQVGIFRRKMARGQGVDEILAVNAAPGYSEHHSGRALDITCPGEPAAEESFEQTAAFEWLVAQAEAFGFRLSYPRDNPHGIDYEPWHWCRVGPAGAGSNQDVRSASPA